MTQQDDEPNIQRQFAQLQAEMKRVMAEPSPAAAARPAEPLTDVQSIEQGLDALRRDADRLRARMDPATEQQAISADTLAALRAWNDENADRLTRAVQRNREAIDDMALRLDDLARRRPARWPVPLAILLGALAIAAAVLLSSPGRTERLIHLLGATVVPPGPHAENTAPPDPARAKAEIAEAPQSVTPDPVTRPLAAPPPAASQTVAPQAVVPETAAPPAAEPPTVPAAASTPMVAALPAAQATTAAAVPPPPAAAPLPPTIPAPAPPAVANSPQPAAAEPTPPVALAPPAPHGRIVLRAKGDSWIEVRNRQGGTLVARLLRDGDSWTVPDQAGLVLTTGNAGGLDLLVDGTAAPPLGGVGGVRRDVPLDADLVRAGRYGPDPAVRPKPSAASK